MAWRIRIRPLHHYGSNRRAEAERARGALERAACESSAIDGVAQTEWVAPSTAQSNGQSFRQALELAAQRDAAAWEMLRCERGSALHRQVRSRGRP